MKEPTHEEKQEIIRMARLQNNDDFLYLKNKYETKIKSTISFNAPRGSMQYIAGLNEPFKFVEETAKKA